MKKVVLSYSGGLDTSVCISLLREHYGFDEVVTVTVDVGQKNVKEAEENSLVDKHVKIDAKDQFVRDYVFPLIKANGNYEGYVLGTAISRVLIAKHVVEVAIKEGADAVAHGCTGFGNDQLRFEVIFRTSGLPTIAPIRELNMQREEEIAYAKERGLPVEVTKERPWSIDENLWSRSIEGGKLDDPSYVAPEDVFLFPGEEEGEEIIEIGFEKGVPVSIDGNKMRGVELIRSLNKIAGKYGIGRVDMMEDRVIGTKTREIYEHPAATVLLRAHKDLEQTVLTRRELEFKEKVDKRWSELVYKGLTVDPLFEDLSAFIEKSQERVTGVVKVKLRRFDASIVGRSSPYALSREPPDQREAESFIKYYG